MSKTQVQNPFPSQTPTKEDSGLKIFPEENEIIQSFSMLKTITQGSTAQICLVKNKNTNELLVQKSFLKDCIQAGLPEREYDIMKQISDHKNILKLQDCWEAEFDNDYIMDSNINNANSNSQANFSEPFLYQQQKKDNFHMSQEFMQAPVVGSENEISESNSNKKEQDCLKFDDESTPKIFQDDHINNSNNNSNIQNKNRNSQKKYRKGSLNKQYLHLEYCENGELFEYVKMEKFSREIAQYYFIQLIKALQHLHRNHSIAHRDIKLENILMDKNFQLKLADFGFAYNYKENNQLIVQQINQNDVYQQEKEQVNVQVGTLKYMAPELFIDNETIDLEKVDVFACGVTLFSMHIGFSPILERAHPRDALFKFFIQQKQDKFWNGFKRKLQINIDEDFIDLMNKMLEPNASERITIDDIFRHPWVTSFNQDGMYKAKEEQIIAQMKNRKSSFDFNFQEQI